MCGLWIEMLRRRMYSPDVGVVVEGFWNELGVVMYVLFGVMGLSLIAGSRMNDW